MNIDARKEFIKSECDKLNSGVSPKDGKLSAYAKIAKLFDENTFVETESFVTETTSFSNRFEKKAEGVITGYGAVDGRLVFCIVQDYARDKGALSMAGAKKIADAYDMAEKNGAPVLSFFDCDGVKLADGIDSVAAIGRALKAASDAKGIVPQIAVVTGVCSGGLAAVAEAADLVIMAGKNASLSLSPVSVLKDCQKKTDFGSSAFTSKCGLSAISCETEEKTFEKLREVLSYFPSNDTQGEIGVANADDPNRDSSAIEQILLQSPADGEKIVRTLTDDGKFCELYAELGKEMLVGFASIDGFSVGILASNAKEGLKLTSDGAWKASRMIDLCDSFSLPVITICDCDGYDPKDETDNPTLAADISALALSYAQSESPMITVIAGKLTGSAFSVLGSKALGADMVFALPTASISPLPTASAVEFMMQEKLAEGKSREELIEEWETEISSPVWAAKAGHVDYICEASELRARLAAALNMLTTKASF